MQFNLPLYSRLFYIMGGSDVFLFVFCIGFFQSFVVLILGIPRAIIMSGKLFPVKITKIAIPSVAFDKPNKQFQRVCQLNCVMQHNSVLVREQQLGDNPERLFLGKLRSGSMPDLSFFLYAGGINHRVLSWRCKST